MGQLRKARSAIRRQVTLLVRDLEALLLADETEATVFQSKMEVLNKNNAKLEGMDEQVLLKMTTTPTQEEDDKDGGADEIADQDKELDEELKMANDYQEKVTLVTVRVREKLIPTSSPRTSPTPSESSTTMSEGGERRKQYKLPKITLKKFDGRLHDWLGWWSQFSKIHEDADLHDVDKFMYLSQSMVPGTRAKELVDSYPMTAGNYLEVIRALKDRFGQEDLLIPHYIRGLLKIVVTNATNKEKMPLSTLYDKLETDIRSLGTLNVTTEEMARFLHPIVESCLSEEIFMTWQRSHLYEKDGSTESPPKSKLDYLLQFLREESQREMKREQAKADFSWDSKAEKKADPKKVKVTEETPTNAGLLSQGVKEKRSCIFCDKSNHSSSKCFKAGRMSPEEKQVKVKEKKACYICLAQGHRASSCEVKLNCKFCAGRHFDIMCSRRNDILDVNSGGEQSGSGTVVSHLGVQCQSDVLLKTMMVKVKNPHTNETRVVRVLFDDGSQRSYITRRTVTDIKSQAVGREESRIVLMNGTITDYENTNKHEIELTGLGLNKKVKIIVREKPQIGCATPKVPSGPWIQKLKKMKIFLTDWEMTHVDRVDIDLLIGSDYYEIFRTGKRIQVDAGLYAVETIFGWTLSGSVPDEKSLSSFVTQSYFGAELSKLWDLEFIGIRDSADLESKTEKDQRVKQELLSHILRDETGRYSVRLPWINGMPEIPTNRAVAEKRLERATTKLIAQGEYSRYDALFKDWMKEGFIEEVTSESGGHYLPHRPVLKPESQTTPVRPVFDASCRVGKNPSLNMCLETGPNMLELIPAILLRFRRNQVGVLADIRKAFQMIGVLPEDRKFQKFLWWVSPDMKEIVEYQHCKVVFGMTCSPFILAAVLDHHLENCEDKKTANYLRKSLYVDNVATSVKGKEEYVEFREKSTAILAETQMDLRLWESNADEGHEKEVTTVLGLKWNKAEDTLYCKIPQSVTEFDVTEVVTSRKVLSAVAQVFDPIGFTCASVIVPKVLLQGAWLDVKKWDDEWKEELASKFREWIEEMQVLTQIKIPRFAFKSLPESSLQLHVFCDASCLAYAGVAFIRIEDVTGVHIQLLMAKSRVAPLEKKKPKKVTIPRLELLACVIGARLSFLVRESLDFQEVPIHFWSDSTTCLAWINRDEDWGTFVGNRVREVVKLTDKNQWRHVPGCMNPADLPSRGCNPRSLLESRWWEGPEWLKLLPEDWPTSQSLVDEDEINQEKKKTTLTSHVVEKVLLKFSHYLKNVRVASWMRRFMSNAREKTATMRRMGELSFSEIKAGERDLILQIQTRHYGSTPKVKGFAVAKQPDGLWHLKTRLTERMDTEDFKYPILLPKDEPLVEQLVKYVHQTSYHSGTQHVLGRLRERYWVVHARTLVKKVIRGCVKCQRYYVDHLKCAEAPLPEKRIETVAAFQTTGVDLAGPLMLKGGKKVWIVLFTCAVYRGVHLDVVDSLNSEAFLMSLERFVNTIGRPHTIYSDNGTNFVGTNNLFKKLDWEKIRRDSGARRINWVFIVPSSPWWGGWWERLVRSMKEILRKMLGRAKLTYDGLRTCLAAAAQVMNDRPLTTMTADAGDLIPLTPSLFMKDLPVTHFPESEEVGAKFLQGSYEKLQTLKSSLQARFRKEYLGFLTSRNCNQFSDTVKIGALVLVGDSNKKRFEWPLGRIVDLIPGKDGKIRVVKVKTTTGTLTRPLQRLYPLEIPNYEDIPSPPKLSPVNGQEKIVPETTTTKTGRVVKKTVRYGEWKY